jgi:nitronate monooxygenase
MDPDDLPIGDVSPMSFGSAREKPKAWKHIWGSGQGIGAVKSVGPAADLVARIEKEYHAAYARLQDRMA